MCDRRQKVCQHLEELTGIPGDCSPEQIRKCQGEVKDHPCAPE